MDSPENSTLKAPKWMRGKIGTVGRCAAAIEEPRYLISDLIKQVEQEGYAAIRVMRPSARPVNPVHNLGAERATYAGTL